MLPVRPWQQQGQQAPAVYACEAPASSRQPATRKPCRGSSLASPDAGHTALSQHDHAARRPALTARASCRPPPCLRCRVRWSGLPARPPRLPRRAAAARWLGCRQVAAALRGAGLPSGRGRCPGSLQQGAARLPGGGGDARRARQADGREEEQQRGGGRGAAAGQGRRHGDRARRRAALGAPRQPQPQQQAGRPPRRGAHAHQGRHRVRRRARARKPAPRWQTGHARVICAAGGAAGWVSSGAPPCPGMLLCSHAHACVRRSERGRSVCACWLAH